MSKDSNLLFYQLSRISELERQRRRRMTRIIASTCAILMLSFLGVSLTYEWKFCHDFPRAQSCGWSKLIKDNLP